MANKYFRQNFNKGGGADTGKAGERKSKTAVAVDKFRKRLKRAIGRPAPTGGIKDLLDRKPSTIKNKTSKSPMERQRKLDTLKSEAAKRGSIVMSGDEMQKLKGESDKSFKQRMDKAFKAKKGGRAALRMGTKKNFNKEEREVQKKVDRDALIFGAKKAIKNAKQKSLAKSVKELDKRTGKDKVVKVFDTVTGKNVFESRNKIMSSGDRFKPVEGNITKMLKASDKAKADKRVMDYMKSKEPGARFSDKDIQMAKDALGMKKGGRAKMMGGGMMGRRFGMKEGSLKPVDPKTQKGLSKLPTKVRNKMGYMKKGGRA